MTRDLPALFERLLDPAATVATAPLLALGIGVVLFLLCEIVGFLRPARGLAFLGTIVVAFLLELRILGMEQVPGAVLDGTLVADRGTALFGCLFLIGTLFAWFYSHGYYRESRPFKPEHDALMLTTPAGMMLMVGASDLIVFFVGLELLSIPLYALAAFQRSRARSVEAGLKYFLLGSFSSAMFLYGAALLYAATGTVSIPELATADLTGAMPMAGLALASASLFFKTSVFPFHLWVPDVYQGSPSPVTALMATGTKAAAFGFPGRAADAAAAGRGRHPRRPARPGDDGPREPGSAGPDRPQADAGLLGRGPRRHAAPDRGRRAGRRGTGRGRARRAVLPRCVPVHRDRRLRPHRPARDAGGPLLEPREPARSGPHPARRGGRPLAVHAVAGGIPATGGFLGKWFAFSVLVEADLIAVAVLGALLSVVALGYYLRVIVTLYMQPPAEGAPRSAPGGTPSAALATALCVVLVLATGLLPALFLGPLGS